MAVPQDLRLAVRLLGRSPGTTALAVLSIALSAGAASVVFAAVKAVLIDPLPYTRARELVQLRSEFPGAQEQSHGDWVLWNDTREVARRTRTLGAVGVYGNAIFDLAGGAAATPEALYGVRMNADLFAVLGVAPMIGRNVASGEDLSGRPDEMILSYGLWARRFHSDPKVVGRAVTVNGHDCLVIGVMPPEFNFPLRREAAHTPSPYVEFWAAPLNAKNPAAGMGAVARLRPGVSLSEARRDLTSISGALVREFPKLNRDRVLRMNALRDRAIGTAANGLLLLMAAAVLFLLTGCANVANLLLARGISRQREFAVRLAMGAPRGRIVRQLLTESLLLAAMGGLAACALTAAAWRILPAVAPVSIPRLAAARADTAVFVFCLALAVVNGVLFGIAPALRLSGTGALAAGGFAARGSAGDRRDRVRSTLVAAEVAAAVVLVVAGGQLLGGFVKLVDTDPGFQPDRVLASVVLPAPERYPDAARRGLFYRRMLDAARALPGVESAGTVDALPFSGENHGGFISGADGTRMDAEIDIAGGEYMQSMGMRLLEGRWFRGEEMNESSDSAIVNELVAKRLYPGGAIGQRICAWCTPENPANWKRITGVVANASHSGLDEPEIGNVYLAAGAMQHAQFLVIRTRRPAGEMGQALRRAIAAIDPNQPVFLSASMAALVADSVAGRRFILILLAATACLALAMSVAGIYGVVSYTTSRRTREIGIRMAVGATPGDVFGLIFRQGFAAVAAGLAVGSCVAMALSRVLGSSLAGFETGPRGYMAMAFVLTALAAGAACWIPSRRATRTDPAESLRQE